MIDIGLRIDVDTYRGTRDGVPRLLEILARHDVKASFFFTTGPDNMGRHMWRLLRPSFVAKMLRSNAASLYGWDIALAGTMWPGRRIAHNLGPVIRATKDAGHEVGLHAWDHHYWQAHAGRLSVLQLRSELARGYDALGDAIGTKPTCSAAAGWICNERVVEAKASFEFEYNSDCRGSSAFKPVIEGREYTAQIPTTMPTYDEVIGRNGVDNENYNEWILRHAHPERLNVLTIHAEVEGIICAPMFDRFLQMCSQRDIDLLPLGELPALGQGLPRDAIVQAPIAGREGDVCWQRSAVDPLKAAS